MICISRHIKQAMIGQDQSISMNPVGGVHSDGRPRRRREQQRHDRVNRSKRKATHGVISQPYRNTLQRNPPYLLKWKFHPPRPLPCAVRSETKRDSTSQKRSMYERGSAQKWTNLTVFRNAIIRPLHAYLGAGSRCRSPPYRILSSLQLADNDLMNV